MQQFYDRSSRNMSSKLCQPRLSDTTNSRTRSLLRSGNRSPLVDRIEDSKGLLCATFHSVLFCELGIATQRSMFIPRDIIKRSGRFPDHVSA
jgi:hypothetical protein